MRIAVPTQPAGRAGARSTIAPWRDLAAGFAIAGLVATGAAACTSDEPVPIGSYQLVFFDSCADALADLQAATKAVVGPYGLPGSGVWFFGDGAMPPIPTAVEDRAAAGSEGGFAADAPAPAAAPGAEPPAAKADDHSGTNVHEAGVDEPDLVKTDGKRIVTVSAGRLSVVDVASRRLVGVVDLLDSDIGYDANLLLAGDHALVLSSQYDYPSLVVEDVAVPPVARDLAPIVPPDDEPRGEPPIVGARLVLLDLNVPRVLARAQADGSIVDARQVGSTVRVVTRSAPRLYFPQSPGSDAERLAANRAVIDAAGIEAWAPRLEVTTGDETVRTRVGCESISRPTSYSGTNLLTVLSFDLSRDTLGDGSPVTIAADGDTVYSNGRSLYVASNQAWSQVVPALAARTPVQPRTEIYRFDTTTTPPRFVGGGSVPGHLINQYAMSEWDGRLRVAATTDAMDAGGGAIVESQSGVYVLEPRGKALVQVGAVEGLGLGERIYAVRFVGPVGYVVTFRQTDPLYTVDLRNPTAPVVRGELKIPGYSAYLHPVGDARLIGVGQDATDTGQTLGTQVSLFDVADLAAPTRIAKYTLAGAYSEAEVDPHAFLYWPDTGLLVVPLQSRYVFAEPVPMTDAPDRAFAPMPQSGALVLRITGDQIVEVGFVSHPTVDRHGYYEPIRRSLITTAGSGMTLWTVSGAGLMATDPTTLARLAWIPL